MPSLLSWHISDTIIIWFLWNKFLKWKKAFESKGLKVILGETKVMVSDGITKDGLTECKVDPCGVCSLRVKANSVLCVQCGRWMCLS